MLVLLGSGALSAGPSPRMRVWISHSVPPGCQLLEATAVKEATLIWARYGVELARGPDSLGRTAPSRSMGPRRSSRGAST